MQSLIKEIGPVQFPANTGERVYMLPFTIRDGLPNHLSRWQPTIDSMLHGVDADGPIYLMIDQGRVKAGETHRRGGPHVDGNWITGVSAHGNGGPHHGIPIPQPSPTPRPKPRHAPGQWSIPSRWNTADFAPEALILASDVTASCAYIGEIEGDPQEGGDCSHLDLSSALRMPLWAGKAYVGNVTMIHESLPVPVSCSRTLVRLNVPGYVFA